MKKLTDNLDAIADKIRLNLSSKDEIREKVLPLTRELIRYSSLTIRAVHRHEFAQAQVLLESAKNLFDQIKETTEECIEFRYTGSVRDSQKEFVEASSVLALLSGHPLPTPDELDIDYAAYLNGLGDTVGELRRYLLDNLRHGDLSYSEDLLDIMDDIYSVLVTMDFPDAITGGLRHTTDNVRGILEKTRGDLTMAIRQKELESKLESFQKEQG